MQREECSQGITLNLHDGVGLKIYSKEALTRFDPHDLNPLSK